MLDPDQKTPTPAPRKSEVKIEEWDSEKNYRRGDEVSLKGVLYELEWKDNCQGVKPGGEELMNPWMEFYYEKYEDRGH